MGKQDEGYDQDEGEDAACQDAGLEVVACLLGDGTDQAGAEGTAQVTGHGQEGKEGCAALGDAGGCDADSAGPHEADGEAAADTAGKTEDRVL